MNQTGQSEEKSDSEDKESAHKKAAICKWRKTLVTIPILFAAFSFGGCAQLEKTEPISGKLPAREELDIRNNAASLFYDLVGDEKNVSKILIVKQNSEEFGRLIEAISKTAADDEKQLENLATNDSSLNLHAIELPQGEVETRDAVSKSKERELLFSSGKEFEFNLLLTQAEALNYGWHLAKIASENSSLPEESQKFAAMSRSMENLYDRVISRMQQNK